MVSHLEATVPAVVPVMEETDPELGVRITGWRVAWPGTEGRKGAGVSLSIELGWWTSERRVGGT